MTWTASHITLRVLSPIHIGWRKIGNLQQTRPYVTGRSLWGAFTARLTRELGSNDYKGIGTLVDQQLAFTYFYPATQLDNVLLWPWSNQWDQFAWTFLGSYASTALADGRSAEAGSLHETEYIAPYTRTGQPVYLVGYAFQQDSYAIGYKWQDVLSRLQLGGERSYGWGRVQLKEPCQPITNPECFGYDLILDHERPLLRAKEKGARLLAHTRVSTIRDNSSNQNQIVRQDREVAIEPLIGRETNDKTGFGRELSKQAEICWVPGGKVGKDEQFQILKRGIWEELPRTTVHLPDAPAAS